MSLSVTPFESLASAVSLEATDEILVRQTRNTLASYGRVLPQGIANYVGPNLSSIPCPLPLSYNFSTDPNYAGLAAFSTVSTDAQTVTMVLGGKGVVTAPQYAAVSANLTANGDFTVGGAANRDRVVAFQLSHTPTIDSTTTGTAGDLYKFILQIRDKNNAANKLSVSIASTGNSTGTGNIVVQFPDGTTIKNDTGASIASVYTLTVYVNLETGAVGIVLNGVDLGYQPDASISDNAVYVLSPSTYVLSILGEDSTVSTQSYVNKSVSASLVTTYSSMGYLPEFASDLNGTWDYAPHDNPAIPVRPLNLSQVVVPLTINSQSTYITGTATAGTATNPSASTPNSLSVASGTVSTQFVLIGDTSLFAAAANLTTSNFMVIQANTTNTTMGTNGLTATTFTAASAGATTQANNIQYVVDPNYVPGTSFLVEVAPSTGVVTVITNNGTFVIPTTANGGASVPLTTPSGAATAITMGIGTLLFTNDTATHTATIDIVETSSSPFTAPTGSAAITGTVGAAVVGTAGTLTLSAPTSSTTTGITLTRSTAGVSASVAPISGTITTPSWVVVTPVLTGLNELPVNGQASATLVFGQNPLPTEQAYWFSMKTGYANAVSAGGGSYFDTMLLGSTEQNPTAGSVSFLFTNVNPATINANSGECGLRLTFSPKGGLGQSIVVAPLNTTTPMLGGLGAGTNLDSQGLYVFGTTPVLFILDPIAGVLDIVLSGVLESQVGPYGTPATGVATGMTNAVYSVSLAQYGLGGGQPLYITANANTSNGSSVTLTTDSVNTYGITLPSGVAPLDILVPNSLPNDIKIGNRFLVSQPGPLVVPVNGAPQTIQVAAGSVVEVLELPTANGLACAITDYSSDAHVTALINQSIQTVGYANIIEPFPQDGIYAVEIPLAVAAPVHEAVATSATYGTNQTMLTSAGSRYAQLSRYYAPGTLVRVSGGLPTVLLSNPSYDQSQAGGAYPAFADPFSTMAAQDVYLDWAIGSVPAMVNGGTSSLYTNPSYGSIGMFEFLIGTKINAAFNATAAIGTAIGVYLPQVATSATQVTTIPTLAFKSANPVTPGACFAYVDLTNLTVGLYDSALGGATVIGHITLPNNATSINPGDVFTFLVDASGTTPVLYIYYNGILISMGGGITLVAPNTSSANWPVVPGYAPFVSHSGMSIQIGMNTGSRQYSYCIDEVFNFPGSSLPPYGKVYPVPLYPAMGGGSGNAAKTQPPISFALSSNGQTINYDAASTTYMTITNALAGANAVTLAATSSEPLVVNVSFIAVQNSATSGDLTITMSGVTDPLGHGTVLVIPPGANALYEINNASTPQMRRLDIANQHAPVAVWNGTNTFNVALSQVYDVYPIDLSQATVTTGVVVALPAFTASGWPIGEFTLVMTQGATPVTGLTLTGAHFPNGTPVFEDTANATTIMRFVTDIHGNIINTYMSTQSYDKPLPVVLATTDVSIPNDTIIMVNSAATAPLNVFAAGTLVQKKSIVLTQGAAATTVYDPLPINTGMKVIVVQTTTNGSTLTNQLDADGNIGLVLMRDPSATQVGNPQLTGSFAAYAALGWATNAATDPAFRNPMLPIGTLSLAEVAGPTSFSTVPLTGTISSSTLSVPSTLTGSTLATSATGASAISVVGAMLSGVINASGVSFATFSPNSASLGTSATAIGEFVVQVGDASVFKKNTQATSSYLQIASSNSANGLSATPYTAGTAGTAVTIDANYVAGTPFIVTVNQANGAIEVVTNNGTFAPAVTVGITANTTMAAYVLIESLDTNTHSASISVSGAAVGTLTVPSGAVAIPGLALASLPTPIVVGHRYLVSAGGPFVQPSGATIVVPTGAVVEVGGTVAAPSLIVTYFYQNTDIQTIANSSAVLMLPTMLNNNNLLTTSSSNGIYTAQATTTAFLGGSVYKQVYSGDSVVVNNSKLFVMGGSTNVQNSMIPTELLPAFVAGSVSPNYVNGNTASTYWNPNTVPCISIKNWSNTNVVEFVYVYNTAASWSAVASQYIEPPLTELVIGIFAPLQAQASAAVDVSLVPVSQYNAALIPNGQFFCYIDVANNEFVINDNPNSITTGTTLAKTTLTGLYPLNNNDVIGFEIGGGSVNVYKNGVSIGTATVDASLKSLPASLVPFAFAATATLPSLGVEGFSVNTGSERYIYQYGSGSPVSSLTLLDFEYMTKNSLPTGLLAAATRSITLTPTVASVTLNLSLFADATVTVGTGNYLLTLTGGRERVKRITVVNPTTTTVNVSLSGSAIAGQPSFYVAPGATNLIVLEMTSAGTYYATNIGMVGVSATIGATTTAHVGNIVGQYDYEVTTSAAIGLSLGMPNGANFPFRVVVVPTAPGSVQLPTADAQARAITYLVPGSALGITAASVVEYAVDASGLLYCYRIATIEPFEYYIPTVKGYGANPATTSTIGDIPTMVFSKTTSESVSFTFTVTENIDITRPLKLKLSYTGDTASNNYVIQLGYQVFSANQALGTPSYTNVTETIAAPATAGELMLDTTSTAVIPANALHYGYLVACVVSRLPTNASDTNTGNLELIDIALVQ